MCGLSDANSAEFGPDATDHVIATMEEQKGIVSGDGDLGGTMRLGAYPADLAEGSVVIALGTVADVAPLRGENRTLVYHGLRSLSVSRNPGIRALMDTAGLLHRGAGVEDAALFKSTDGGQTWHELTGMRGHGTGESWQPGAGGLCLHTILIDRNDPDRMFTAISAAGTFRSEDGGETWKAINRGLVSNTELPDPDAEVGHCVHRIAMHPARPDVLLMQKHWDVMRSDDGGDSWAFMGLGASGRVSRIRIHPDDPATVYVAALGHLYGPQEEKGVFRTRNGGESWERVLFTDPMTGPSECLHCRARVIGWKV